MNLINILLQVGAAGGSGTGAWSGILMMVLLFGVMYFFMIRPQSKRQKEIQKQREAMKVGDRIVTSGGVYGKIRDIKENTVTVEISDNVRVSVDKNSVFVAASDIQKEAK